MILTPYAEMEFFARILVAALCGAFIGYERNNRLKEAGIRTHLIVALAAALIMVVSKYGFGDVTTHPGIALDPSRIAAQIVTGVGFLGAGMIFVRNQNISGLTTAAGLWASACMGLAVGGGFYECVGLAFLLIFLVVHLLPAVELYIVENAKNMNIYVEFHSLNDVAEIINRIKAKDVTIYEVEVDHGKQTPSQHPNAVFSLRMNRPGTHAKILAAISELEDVYVVHDI